MREGILYQLIRDRAESLGRAVESWRQDHEDALAAQDLEDLARSCLDLPPALHEVWARFQAPDVARAGSVLLAGYARLLELMESVARHMRSVLGQAQSYQAAGYTVEALEELAAGVAEVQHLLARVREGHDWLSTPLPPGTKTFGDPGPFDPSRYVDLGEFLAGPEGGADRAEG
jgi:hypothetical protein